MSIDPDKNEMMILADDYAHKFAFVGDDEMPKARNALAQAIICQLDKIARLEAECAALKSAFESACDFIDSHVADPDITNEMWTNYAIFSERRKLIAAMQAGAES